MKQTERLSMAVEVRIPSLGESVSQGVITRWLKENGDAVAADDILLELETDKATMEIPAEAAGRLEILKPAGETVDVGTVVARIADGDGARAGKPKSSSAPTQESKPAPAVSPTAGNGPKPAVEATLSPAVRRLLAEHHIDPGELSGTGKGGRLTKEDVLRVIEGGQKVPAPTAAKPPPAETASVAAGPPFVGRPAVTTPMSSAGATERVPMTRLRKRIAERLVEAQRTAAILTTFNEIDMSATIELRKRHKERFQKAHGIGLGFMSLFARACVLALRELPIVNASIEGDDIVYHRQVHLGIAVGTPRGLVVPVVRNADGTVDRRPREGDRATSPCWRATASCCPTISRAARSRSRTAGSTGR